MTTITRCITMPILKPVIGEWKELTSALNASWRCSTVAANAIISALYASDMAAMSNENVASGELPAMPKLNTYQVVKRILPDMPTGTISAVDRAVRRRYTGKNSRGWRTRWASLTGLNSVPSFRYPFPYPCRAQDWRPDLGLDGEPIIYVTLAPKQRWAIQLKRGDGFQPMYRAFKKMVEDGGKYRELKIVGGNAKRPPMVAIAIDFQVKERKRTGTLNARTDAESLLIVENNGSLWRYHADHLKRRIAEYATRMQRLSDDMKHEPRQIREEIDQRRTAIVNRHNRAINSAIAKAAAWLVGYADRRSVARIEYDDSERSFIGRFAWNKLETLMKQKSELCGIQFEKIKAQEAAK